MKQTAIVFLLLVLCGITHAHHEGSRQGTPPYGRTAAEAPRKVLTDEEVCAEVERALAAIAEALDEEQKALKATNAEAERIKETINRQLDNINYKES